MRVLDYLDNCIDFDSRYLPRVRTVEEMNSRHFVSTPALQSSPEVSFSLIEVLLISILIVLLVKQ